MRERNRKLSDDDKAEIQRRVVGGEMYKPVAKDYGVSITTIRNIAAKVGVSRHSKTRNEATGKVLALIDDDPSLLDDRKELAARASAVLGYTVDRLYINNVVSRNGLGKTEVTENEFRSMVSQGLRVDALGLPSYGDKADAAMLDMLGSEEEDPPEWLLEAYLPWVEARKQAVREQTLAWWKEHGDGTGPAIYEVDRDSYGCSA